MFFKKKEKLPMAERWEDIERREQERKDDIKYRAMITVIFLILAFAEPFVLWCFS